MTMARTRYVRVSSSMMTRPNQIGDDTWRFSSHEYDQEDPLPNNNVPKGARRGSRFSHVRLGPADTTYSSIVHCAKEKTGDRWVVGGGGGGKW